jgi:hypothetical protein
MTSDERRAAGSARDENYKATAARIRVLNDAFRRSFVGGRVMMTQGIAALSKERRAAIFEAVRRFDRFTPDNDPHGEHDFGAIDHAGQRIFWKIDYYDETLSAGSEDPADPSRTTRVLTVMLAEEY